MNNLRFLFLLAMITASIVFQYHENKSFRSSETSSIREGENFVAFNKEINNINQDILKIMIELDELKLQKNHYLVEDDRLVKRYEDTSDQTVQAENQLLRDSLDKIARTLDEPSSLESATSQVKTPEEKIAELDASMFNQVSDPSWELQASDELNTGFQNAKLENASLESTYCRASMCRMEVSYVDPLELEKLIGGEVPIVSWAHKGQAHTVDDGGGKLRTVFYLTRK